MHRYSGLGRTSQVRATTVRAPTAYAAPYHRVVHPAELRRQHGLPTTGLEPVAGGTVNRVWRTARHVVCLSPHVDHEREARLPQTARTLGIRTPRPVAWGSAYSIWELIPGHPAHSCEWVNVNVWLELLADLQVLHAHPLEPRPPRSEYQWRGRVKLVAATQDHAGWTGSERHALEHVLGVSRPLHHVAFIHGDAYARNVLVDDAGTYVALLDWGCARWSALEEECARLEDDALTLALERLGPSLDTGLMWAMRVDLLLEVTHRDRTDGQRLRGAIARAGAELKLP